jgi:endonuclease/exonuclease/phosphatase family metal-dependent hydrolase
LPGLLVRTWNLFHGNTVPPGRSDRLEAMVRLATADRPDVVCLQEVPAWALGRLGEWSGMEAFGAVAARPSVGPLPSTPAIGRRLTGLHHGFLRSAFAGQANAILVAPGLRALAQRTIRLNAPGFRRAQARWLGLPLLARLAWARERRVCQALRVSLPDGRTMLVANLHATSYRPDGRLADAELLRAAVFADALAAPADLCVLAGDFNVNAAGSWTLRELTGAEWGFSAPGPAIDHVLVRGADVGSVEVWPEERRRLDGALLSDHAPVEVRIG